MTEIVRGEDLSKGIAVQTAGAFRNAYRNNKTVWMLPTRGAIPLKVHVSLRNMAWPMNTPRACLEMEKWEVGAAYEEMTEIAMTAPELKSYPFIWTYEEDNIQPHDVFFKLFEAIWTCIDCGELMPQDNEGYPAEPWVCKNGHKGLDGVGALYFTKSYPPMAMAYGDPKLPEVEMRPRDVTEAMKDGKIIEVNGLAMGSTLWRKGLFSKVSRPWFKTLSGGEPERAGAFTQDLYFSRKAKEEAGARFAVHCGCVVGHLDSTTGVVF